QANIRAEKQEVNANQDQDGNVENKILLKKHRTNERKIGQWSPGEVRQAQISRQSRIARAVGRLHEQQIICQTERDNVVGNATDYLIGLKINRNNRVNQRNQATANDRSQQTDPYIIA